MCINAVSWNKYVNNIFLAYCTMQVQNYIFIFINIYDTRWPKMITIGWNMLLY